MNQWIANACHSPFSDWGGRFACEASAVESADAEDCAGETLFGFDDPDGVRTALGLQRSQLRQDVAVIRKRPAKVAFVSAPVRDRDLYDQHRLFVRLVQILYRIPLRFRKPMGISGGRDSARSP